jgi:hypothetical protein
MDIDIEGNYMCAGDNHGNLMIYHLSTQKLCGGVKNAFNGELSGLEFCNVTRKSKNLFESSPLDPALDTSDAEFTKIGYCSSISGSTLGLKKSMTYNLDYHTGKLSSTFSGEKDLSTLR